MKRIVSRVLLVAFVFTFAIVLSLSGLPNSGGDGPKSAAVNQGEKTESASVKYAMAASDSKTDDTITPEYSSFKELQGKNFGILTGAPFDELVSKHIKGAKFSYYDSFADILLALKAGKIDAAVNNSAVALYQSNTDEDLALMEVPLQEMYFGIAFNKGDKEAEKWKKALDEVGEEEIEKLWKIWLGTDDSKKKIPKQDWPGKNGTVKVAQLDNLEPMSYRGDNGELQGFDPAVLLTLAKHLDVKVEFEGMELSALLPYVASGKADFAMGSMLINADRLETMDMVPYHSGNLQLVVRSKAAGKKMESEKGFKGAISKFKASFKRTFIKDNRYKLLTNGLLATCIIAVFSGIFGLIFGFILVYLARLNNVIINGIIRVLEEILVGLPAAVILLVLYYVIFGRVTISAIIVAVIGFMLMFGVKTYSVVKSAILAVDKGQMEAALSLGYTETKAFTKIILPQAKKIFFPLLKGQFVVLIKDTSIVGFITVIDLTRAGDLIRSRTMEAFFPLITVAVFYFILIKLLSWLITFIDKKISARVKHNKRLEKYKEEC
ncbi:MAG: transporter substrate-binding domain-containing protein [Lachnospiraceae bacterium]|nr:transporter substrate-binding domain-containing protein [Lachnospiraceae bacterium]